MLAVLTTISQSPTKPPLLKQVAPDANELFAARRRLHRKAASIVAVTVSGYTGLVFVSLPVAFKVACAVLLIHGLIAVATGIMHDANHHAFSTSPKVNRALGYSGDFLGASSWLWRQQHNVQHHHNTNVMGVDGDIDQQPFARMSPEQPWRPWHRAQALYMWPLYGFLTLKWVLFGDFVSFFAASKGTLPMVKRPSAADFAKMVAGKVGHFAWAVAIPLTLYPWQQVAATYLAISWSVGFALAIIFQLAHCVDRAEFIQPNPSVRLTGDDMMRHQLATTVNVAPASKLGVKYVGWLMGGLEFQIEHHLAPRVPHTFYPTLAKRVRSICAENDLEYRTHFSVISALRSHARWLHKMGQPS